tara:strand:- start:1930 stop:2058 length:129 start_codon:yes stop_codon:yes gene_type:complete
MSLKDIAKELVEAVNETTNDYDAREKVLSVLVANMEELEAKD